MRQYLIIIALALITIPFLLPFFKVGYFETDDGLWAIVRQASMHNELRQGQFPVRWSGTLNYGHGYPLFQFSYPGPYYIGEVFHLIGFSFTDTVKTLFVLSTILSVVTMYIFARTLWKSDLAGVIAALLYLSAPYRFVNLYIRGSIGETIAFLLFPLMCFFALKLLQTGKRRYLLAGAMLISLLIITHNVMAFLFLPFFVYFIIVETFIRNAKMRMLFKEYLDELKKNKSWYKKGITFKLLSQHIAPLIIMFVLGITLSATFWVPAVFELQYVKLGSQPLTDIAQEFKKQEGLLLTPLDSHSRVSQTTKGVIEENLEFEYIILALVSVAVLIFYKNKYEYATHRILLYAIPTVIILVLLTPLSIELWRNIPGLKSIDFPWRVLGILSFIIPVAISSVALIPKIRIIGLCISIVSLFLVSPLIIPGQYYNHPDEYFATNQGTTTSAAEYTSKWMINSPTSSSKIISDTHLIPVKNTSTEKIFKYTSSESSDVVFPIMYFPGWKLTVDNAGKVIIPWESNGLIKTTLPSGNHIVRLTFSRSHARIAGDSITIVSLVGIGILCTIEYLRGKKFIL